MRMLRFLISYALFSIFGIMLSFFIAQNAHAERIAFYGVEFSTNLGLVMVAAAAIGFMLALLLLFPSRVAAALHSRSLDREASQLERRLEMLYDQREHLLSQHDALMVDHEELLYQYQRLLAGHSRVLAERDHARKALSSASAAGSGKQTKPVPIPLPPPVTVSPPVSVSASPPVSVSASPPVSVTVSPPTSAAARPRLNGDAIASVEQPPADHEADHEMDHEADHEADHETDHETGVTVESIGLGQPSERRRLTTPTGVTPAYALAAPE